MSDALYRPLFVIHAEIRDLVERVIQRREVDRTFAVQIAEERDAWRLRRLCGICDCVHEEFVDYSAIVAARDATAIVDLVLKAVKRLYKSRCA